MMRTAISPRFAIRMRGLRNSPAPARDTLRPPRGESDDDDVRSSPARGDEGRGPPGGGTGGVPRGPQLDAVARARARSRRRPRVDARGGRPSDSRTGQARPVVARRGRALADV